MLSSARLANLIKRPRLLITAALQLTLGPLATFFILQFFGFPPLLIIILTLVQALPTATSLALFAEKYHGDQGDTSELVVASTLLSCATLPLIVLILPV
jgi:predicted permease